MRKYINYKLIIIVTAVILLSIGILNFKGYDDSTEYERCVNKLIKQGEHKASQICLDKITSS